MKSSVPKWGTPYFAVEQVILKFATPLRRTKVRHGKDGKGSWGGEQEELVIFWKVKVKETG